MLTSVYETLRSAGRELALELGARPARCAARRAAPRRRAASPRTRSDGRARARGAPRRSTLTRGAAAAGASARPRAACARAASGRRATRRRARRSSRRRSTSSRCATASCSRSCCRLRRRLRGREGRESALDFEDLQLRRATSCASTRSFASASSCASARSWSTSSRTRTASSASSSTCSTGPANRRLLRRRRVPVDLRLPPRRRARLPRAARAGRHAAAADAQLPLAARGARGRQPPLRAPSSARSSSRSRPRARSPIPSSARRSSCSSPTRPRTPTRGVHWRRAEARHVARRVQELVETGAATRGRDRAALRGRHGRGVVRGGAARGRPADLPRDRPQLLRPAAGRRPALLPAAAAQPLRRRGARQRARLAVRRRLERRAVLIRRAAARAADLHRASSARCRADSTSATRGCCARSGSATTGSSEASARLSLERLCERIVADHDYDLAVLAQWDGRRRYANLRKLARLARSYEELRGPDVEGFLRFVARAGGRRRRRARRGRRGGGCRRRPAADDPRRQGARVQGRRRRRRGARPERAGGRTRSSASPTAASASGSPTRSRASGTASSTTRTCKDAREAEDEAERLRLYYVAMTRAIDRLIVSGSIDREKADEKTPIGWVLAGSTAQRELEAARRGADRAGAGGRARARPRRPDAAGDEPEVVEPTRPRRAETGSSRSSRRARRRRCRRSRPARADPGAARAAAARVRRLSYSALALFDRCSYRYYAERVAGMRPADAHGDGRRAERSRGDRDRRRGTPAARARRPRGARVAGRRARARVVPGGQRRGARAHRRLRRVVLRLGLARRIAALAGARPERPFAFEHDGVLLHGRLDVLHRDGGAALVLDYKTNSLAEGTPEEIVDADYRLQRLVYALACFRAGAEEVEVVYHFLERAGRRRLDDVRARRTCPSSRRSSPRRSRGSGPASSCRRRASSSAPAARRRRRLRRPAAALPPARARRESFD